MIDFEVDNYFDFDNSNMRRSTLSAQPNTRQTGGGGAELMI